jgi:hypothetical protein
MSAKQLFTAVGTVAGLAGLILAGNLVTSPLLHADDEHSSSDEHQIELGLQIAPVQLTYDKKDRKLVGLGSYLVNAVGECDGCHSAGPPTQYVAGHNPYFLGQTKTINPATYLGGGSDFGAIAPPPSPHIVSRNLTPDTTGLPAGGATFAEFHDIIRTGIDPDHLHPNCTATILTNCFGPVPPFNGAVLQVMPWPAYQDWTDRDLLAIYEYLKAIPCIAGTPGPNGTRDLTKHLCP